jgi:hypothetical protein
MASAAITEMIKAPGTVRTSALWPFTPFDKSISGGHRPDASYGFKPAAAQSRPDEKGIKLWTYEILP